MDNKALSEVTEMYYIFICVVVGGWGREGEKHQCVVASHMPPPGTWPTTQACALTGNGTNIFFTGVLGRLNKKRIKQ